LRATFQNIQTAIWNSLWSTRDEREGKGTSAGGATMGSGTAPMRRGARQRGDGERDSGETESGTARRRGVRHRRELTIRSQLQSVQTLAGRNAPGVSQDTDPIHQPPPPSPIHRNSEPRIPNPKPQTFAGRKAHGVTEDAAPIQSICPESLQVEKKLYSRPYIYSRPYTRNPKPQSFAGRKAHGVAEDAGDPATRHPHPRSGPFPTPGVSITNSTRYRGLIRCFIVNVG